MGCEIEAIEPYQLAHAASLNRVNVQAPPAQSLLQQARLAQWLTVGWMVIEGVLAIGAGVAAHSVALTAFGVDSGIELFSSVVVLRRLLQRSESEERGSMTGGERSATKLVGFALYGLIAYIVLSAGVALVFRSNRQRRRSASDSRSRRS